jgi:soluble lytic murein transglycosylase-like protein
LVLFLLLGAAAMLGCGATGRSSTDATTRHPLVPAQLAVRIEAAQEVVDGKSGSGTRLQKAAWSEQLAFRQLVDHPRLRRPTLPRLSPTARSAAIAALHAAGALSKIVPAERHFPDWRIIAPPPPKRLLEYFRTAGSAYGLRWQYLAAIELVETRMGRIRGLSPAGAQGPMQFMPATWSEYGRGSVNNQRDAITAAARFLAANGGGRNIAGALLHYNPSRSYVVAVEAYAHEMLRDRRAFYGYYNWQVLYRTTRGTFLLAVGYPRVRPRRLPG